MGRAVTWFWEKQPIVELDVDPPTRYTYYEALPLTKYVLIDYIATRRLDDNVEVKAHGIRVTIDGEALIGDTNSNDNTWYYWYQNPAPSATTGFSGSTTLRNADYYAPLKGRGIKVEIRETGIPAANAELDCRIQWAIRKEV